MKTLADYEVEVGLPRTPGKWISKPEYIEVSKIAVSCGGGMGGSYWEIIAKRIEFPTIWNNNFIEVTTVPKGERILINTRNIVTVNNDFSVIKAVADIHNPNFAIGKDVCCYLAKDGHKIRLVNEYEETVERRQRP